MHPNPIPSLPSPALGLIIRDRPHTSPCPMSGRQTTALRSMYTVGMYVCLDPLLIMHLPAAPPMRLTPAQQNIQPETGTPGKIGTMHRNAQPRMFNTKLPYHENKTVGNQYPYAWSREAVKT